jgi:hypothetical protein
MLSSFRSRWIMFFECRYSTSAFKNCHVGFSKGEMLFLKSQVDLDSSSSDQGFWESNVGNRFAIRGHSRIHVDRFSSSSRNSINLDSELNHFESEKIKLEGPIQGTLQNQSKDWRHCGSIHCCEGIPVLQQYQRPNSQFLISILKLQSSKQVLRQDQ